MPSWGRDGKKDEVTFVALQDVNMRPEHEKNTSEIFFLGGWNNIAFFGAPFRRRDWQDYARLFGRKPGGAPVFWLLVHVEHE